MEEWFLMMNTSSVPKRNEVRFLAEKETDLKQFSPDVREEVRKYLRLLPEVAEPNLARVREIKEQIAQGAYLTREMIEESAARLALRFLRKE